MTGGITYQYVVDRATLTCLWHTEKLELPSVVLHLKWGPLAFVFRTVPPHFPYTRVSQRRLQHVGDGRQIMQGHSSNSCCRRCTVRDCGRYRSLRGQWAAQALHQLYSSELWIPSPLGALAWIEQTASILPRQCTQGEGECLCPCVWMETGCYSFKPWRDTMS